MRTIRQCLNLPNTNSLTKEEYIALRKWIDEEARYMYDSYDYCELLGWFVLGQRIPLSPKEAGFD